MNRRLSVAIYGHCGFDVDTRGGEVTRTVGGAAYYAAKAACAAGCDVRLVTILGADFPGTALEHIDCSCSPHSTMPSAEFNQTYSDLNQIISFTARLNACEALAPQQISVSPDSPSWVFLAAAPALQQRQALSWLRSQSYAGRVAIDTAIAYVSEFEDLLATFESFIDLIFLNADEHDALQRPLPPGADIVVKRGPRGASIRHEGAWRHAAAPIVRQVLTTTGAGDVLAGSFLAASLRGKSCEGALEFAVRRATLYVELGPAAWDRPAGPCARGSNSNGTQDDA